MIGEDPTLGIKIKTPKSDGHHTWTEDEIAQFEAAHPIGSKARLALALGLCTVQRRGDVVRMGRQDIRNGWLHVEQEKTGKVLDLPVYLTELPAILDATPSGHLTFLITKTGKPYGANDFSEQFRKWCDDAGLAQRCTFHGLRKAGCRRLAEAGRSANEIAAWSGQSLREVERYTKAADQKRLALNAVTRTAAAEAPSSVSVTGVGKMHVG
jgi:integrase